MSENRPINWIIRCACGFRVIVENPFPFTDASATEQVRRAWFSHLRDVHPDEYAKLSSNFAKALADRRALAELRVSQKVERFGLEAKREAKQRKRKSNTSQTEED